MYCILNDAGNPGADEGIRTPDLRITNFFVETFFPGNLGVFCFFSEME
jgi:hypothetical protein